MLALDLHFEIMFLNCMKIHVFGGKKGLEANTRMFLLYFHAAKSGKAPTDFSEMKNLSLWFSSLLEQVCLS